MLLPVVTNVTNALGKLMGWWNKLGDGSKAVIVGITAVVGVMALVTSAIGSVTGALTTLGLEVKLSFAPWLVVVAGAVAGIVLLWNKCEWFRNGVKAILNGIKAAFIACVNGIKAAWQGVKNVFSIVCNAIKSAWNAVCNFFKSAWQGIVNVVSSVCNTIKAIWQGSCNLHGKL